MLLWVLFYSMISTWNFEFAHFSFSDIAVAQCKSRINRSHKLFVTLSSVAIASKWDEPEKIKVFIVSTVGRKVLQSRKGERHNCTKSKMCGAIQCNLGKEKRTMCNYPGETLLLAI